MEQLEKIQESIQTTQNDVKEMKDFLLGNQFNGKRGLQAVIDDHDKRIEALEEHKALTKIYSDLMKWFFGLTISALIGLVIFFIQKFTK